MMVCTWRPRKTVTADEIVSTQFFLALLCESIYFAQIFMSERFTKWYGL